MKRILLVAVSSSALALAAPGIALAHHHGKRHHKHHSARVRVLDFRSSAQPAPSPGTPTTGAPTGNESVGKVTSFKEGKLTITLNDGTQVSGTVTEQTQVTCTSTAPSSSGVDADDQSGSSEGDQGPTQENQSAHADRFRAHGASSGADDDEPQQSSDDEQQSCGKETLAEGALVREAELKIGSAGAVWDHVDLIK
jgi:hypothetical protein